MILSALCGVLGLPPAVFRPIANSSALITFFLIFLFGPTMRYLAIIAVIIAVVIALLSKFSLEKADNELVNSVLGEGSSVIFAHRGAALDAPENTIAAIELAKKNGAYGVELDLSFTKDGVAIAFHDDDLDRTTNGKGDLSERTWDEIKNLDASHGHLYAEKFSDVKIPTLEDAVKAALKLDLRIVLDIKECDERTVPYLLDLFKKIPTLHKHALVASFYPQVIYSLRYQRSDIVGALIWRPNFAAYHDIEATKPRYKGNPLKQSVAETLDPLLDWAIHNVLWHATGASAVLINKDCISSEYAKRWRNRDIRLLSWTPNLPVEKEFLAHHNVSLITDTLI